MSALPGEAPESPDADPSGAVGGSSSWRRLVKPAALIVASLVIGWIIVGLGRRGRLGEGAVLVRPDLRHDTT